MNEKGERGIVGYFLIWVVLVAVVASLLSTFVQWMLFGKHQPAVSGGVAGAMAGVTAALLRRRSRGKE
jgi:membrane associated rhomboid family serine protease